MESVNFKNAEDCFILSNGVKIPCIGFGTWNAYSDDAYKAVLSALKHGYRHIDTATIYKNEKEVGKAIKDSGIERAEIFVTTKIWNTERGFNKAIASVHESLKELGLDYIDLVLIHWPAAKGDKASCDAINIDTWRALEKLYIDKKIKAIGLSNFLIRHLEPILKEAKIKPMVNQIECHPGYPQKDTLDFCKNNGILVEAWSPLGRGRVLDHPVIVSLSEKYHKTPAQICIKWALQHRALPLPKSVTESRIKSNIEVFDFTIKSEDIKQIDEIPCYGSSGLHPDYIDF